MIPPRVVLDAVALSALLDPRKPDRRAARAVLEEWAFHGARAPERQRRPPFLVPAIALYEVRRGLLRVGARTRVRELDRFLRAFAEVLPFDTRTAETAARLWAERARRGRPAGERDLLILASAVVHEVDVVSRDGGFPRTPEVVVPTWEELARRLAPRKAGGAEE